MVTLELTADVFCTGSQPDSLVMNDEPVKMVHKFMIWKKFPLYARGLSESLPPGPYHASFSNVTIDVGEDRYEDRPPIVILLGDIVAWKTLEENVENGFENSSLWHTLTLLESSLRQNWHDRKSVGEKEHIDGSLYVLGH